MDWAEMISQEFPEEKGDLRDQVARLQAEHKAERGAWVPADEAEAVKASPELAALAASLKNTEPQFFSRVGRVVVEEDILTQFLGLTGARVLQIQPGTGDGTWELVVEHEKMPLVKKAEPIPEVLLEETVQCCEHGAVLERKVEVRK